MKPPPTSRPTRNPNVDYGQQELGWVSLQDIRNVFTEQLREFDVNIWPDRTAGSRPHTMKFFESLQYALYMRAQAHWRAFLEGLSPREREKVEKDATKVAADARDAHQERLARIRQHGST